ncbi:MAG: response regulator transcription factor [Hoeflea sp.]|uniref:response regulator transcription factor n=1 Tax=Hoeflea sp. TaxID=1940281 RepID=UPI0032EAB999
MQISIVDDHPLFLDGLTALLGRIDESFEIEAFSSGTELLASFDPDNLAPALIISDLSMKPINGLALLSSLRAKGFDRPFILVSGVDETLSAAELKASGAFAFVSKSADLPTLRDVIFSALESGSTPGKRGSRSLSGGVRSGSSDYQATTLTPRQIEIMQIIVDGGTNRDVAGRLNISENTVKTHLRQIFQVLGVNKRTACISKARSLGLI